MGFSAFTATSAYTQMIPGNGARKGLLLKNPAYNTDRVWVNLLGNSPQTATTANMYPLEVGESVSVGTLFPSIMACEWPDPVYVQSNSTPQDIRFIEF